MRVKKDEGERIKDKDGFLWTAYFYLNAIFLKTLVSQLSKFVLNYLKNFPTSLTPFTKVTWAEKITGLGVPWIKILCRTSKFRISNSLGFSLVELLIGIAAAGTVGVLLVSMLSQNTRIVSDQNANITQGVDLNNAYTEVADLIKSASGVKSQYPITGTATYTTGLNALVLELPSLNAQGLVIQNTYDYAVIAKDPQNINVLKKKVYPDAASSRKLEDQVLSTKLSKLEFRYFDSTNQTISAVQAAKINFIINVGENIATDTKTSSTSGQINLRNN